MGRLINIDNGGTLTDICVWDGDQVSYTKTLTTPFDLSQCLFDGIEKVSAQETGLPDLAGFLSGTRHVRYSTTQGTNALVERKGPKIGLITDDTALIDDLSRTEVERDLFQGLVGDRTAVIDTSADDDQLAEQLVQVVNRLTTLGAARLVIGLVSDGADQERRVRSILLRAFPRHLLGSVPVLYSSDFAADRQHPRRVWSSIINSFLHPTIERFLYNTEHRLRSHRVRNPLLIYRNDGASSRVAKSVALKTYSSGPRGGLEGTKALAEAYGLKTVLMIDVGGTTTDVGVVQDATIATRRRGEVRGVEVSFPLSDVRSAGVGGSSIIAVVDGRIQVGPRSVGAAPGPACFGFGGEHATITDVNLLLGVLDADTYLDGALKLDAVRAAAVIRKTIAEPLGLSLEEALIQAEHAYFEAIAASFSGAVTDASTTTVAAFGGAGPMSAAGAARISGVRQVLIPKLAAVFSAFGIGFSDVSQTYEVVIDDGTPASVEAEYDELLKRARRDLYQEGHDLEDCTVESTVVIERDGHEPRSLSYSPGDAIVLEEHAQTTLTLTASHLLPHVEIAPDADESPVDAVPTTHRSIRSAADRVDEVPVYTLVDQPAGAHASGPAIVEGPFFTARVLEDWEFRVTAAGDLLLTDNAPLTAHEQ